MHPLNKISWFLLSLTLLNSCHFLSKKDTPKSSMLWKIERNDLEHPTYVLGTMHLINKEYFYFPKELENLVLNSEQLIMELGGLPNATETAQLMRLPDSVQLSDYFNEERMALLYGFAEQELKMNKQAFDLTFGRMKPFVLIQLITQKQFEGPTESFELTLMNLAEENKIKTIGLESIKQQIGFFDAIPMKNLADIISTYFEESDSLKQETKKMQVIYRSGNLDSLADFMINSSPELMEFEDILLTNRNIAWVPKIIDLIYKKPSFIAVGAAHLSGENGLIELLRKEGYTLTPVAF